MDHMGFKIVGTLHVIIVGSKDPSVADWQAYMTALHAEERKGIDVTQMRTLVFSDGGGPNAAQRKMASDLLDGRATRLGIVTGNTLMRGVITALRWFNPQCQAFAPGAVGEALRFLDVPLLKFDSIRQTARDLQVTPGLRPVRALDEARLVVELASARP
jgi:hypothetical protein